MDPLIEALDTRTAPEETLRSLNVLYDEWDAEWRPDEPLTPLAQRLADWRYFRDVTDIPRWIIREGDRIVATSGLFHHRTQDLNNSFGWVFVTRAKRRQGIGRKILAPTIEYAVRDGRGSYLTLEPAESPHQFWPRRLGLDPGYNERVSQLKTADVDRSLLTEWITRASERATDYELQFVGSPVPDEFVERVVLVSRVMDGAPMEGIEEEPEQWTVPDWRHVEEIEAKRGREILSCFAVHKPTQEFVGYTNVAYQALNPSLAYQWDTGVHPNHQNRGLGRWLKAAMMERLLDDYPAIERIETENAESNSPMLNINVAMGFTPAHHQVIYQGDISNVVDYLGLTSISQR